MLIATLPRVLYTCMGEDHRYPMKYHLIYTGVMVGVVELLDIVDTG